MDRITVRSDLEQAVASAVSAARLALVGASGGGGTMGHSQLATALHLIGTDATGLPVTIHDFMIGVDKIGDTSAIIRSDGTTASFWK